ncbi:MAG: hypothetical protein HUJ89_06260 [Bacteroidales bacterium]|nr:hypothetical protein [Bacteroidales bacterium]
MMENESESEYFLYLSYKDRTVKFRVQNPDLPLSQLMSNVKHATGKDGKLIFDFPSVDRTGAPLDYFFGKEDTQINETRILRPRIGRSDQLLSDYNVNNGDTLFIVPDPFPG